MQIMLSVSLESTMLISIYKEDEKKKRGLIAGNYVFVIEWILNDPAIMLFSRQKWALNVII